LDQGGRHNACVGHQYFDFIYLKEQMSSIPKLAEFALFNELF
jgi:hypothetical protein